MYMFKLVRINVACCRKNFMHVVTNISHKFINSFNCSENVLHEVNCNIRFPFVSTLKKHNNC